MDKPLPILRQIQKGKIIDIHPKDSYYDRKHHFINETGAITQIHLNKELHTPLPNLRDSKYEKWMSCNFRPDSPDLLKKMGFRRKSKKEPIFVFFMVKVKLTEKITAD